MKIATLILAAGSSSRMGSPKQLLSVGNTTLLGTVIEKILLLNNNFIYCILGANADTIQKSITKYDLTILTNSNYKSGLSSSIVSGIQHIKNLDYDAVLIVLGDQPNIQIDYFQKIIETWKSSQDFIIASNYTSRKGVPALFPKKYFTLLENLEGDKGASKLLNSDEFPIFTMNSNIDLFDVDTQKDYQTLINKTL
ncbi:MAG: nucleotidyltransferase family protein [Tenacibaculum sp.]|nr:nucleotidyltransferase family protein [Tenacibaculum sp.]